MRKKWLPLTLCLTLLAFPTGGAIVRNLVPSSLSASSHYDRPLSVVTYNIRGCRTDSGTADPELVIAALRTLDADIIALQEVDSSLPRSQFVNQVETIAAGLKMNYAYGPSIDFVIGTYGNAVLSKFPIQTPNSSSSLPTGSREACWTSPLPGTANRCTSWCRTSG